jgi:predicted transcriptional regulator
MEEYDISQLPVIDDDFQVGSISEGAVVRAVSRGDIERISNMSVKETIEEPFPMIPPTADLSVLSHLLEHHPAVLVQENGKVVGIITKHDVMRLLHR